MVRHFVTNLAAYLIAALIVATALLFAWLRSQQFVITNERTTDALFAEVTDITSFAWEELGEASYTVNCRSCHGSEGNGWGAYPGLHHIPALFAAERDYLLQVTLHGLASPRHSAPMPQFLNLPDAEVAAVNNYLLTRFGGVGAAELYVPGEVTPLRADTLSLWEVDALRPSAE